MRSRRNSEAGFTLIELLVVVAVIGVVAAISIISYFTALDKSRQRATMADMRSVARALEAYMVDHNFAPDSTGGVASLTNVLIPYQINVVPVRDHWGNLYNFESNAFDNYTLESFGKDATPGADISYATRMDFNLDILISDGVFKAAPE
ncbi:MAG TPA: prepilin-type N-terminal cleavage/methylation domain-containing protein [Candidatus Polarisedimenticolaceae bacterium]|nr:prepilin-type N-terminal cleavage/methylation domain-containing protein [Candidatus Polarisedimenticolaceae bacterium]